jgi:hypothetical protein
MVPLICYDRYYSQLLRRLHRHDLRHLFDARKINAIDGIACHGIKVIVQQALSQLNARVRAVLLASYSGIVACRPTRSCRAVAAPSGAPLAGLRRRRGAAVHFPSLPSLQKHVNNAGTKRNHGEKERGEEYRRCRHAVDHVCHGRVAAGLAPQVHVVPRPL